MHNLKLTYILASPVVTGFVT